MYNAPWAKLGICKIPYSRVRPSATREYTLPSMIPFNTCCIKSAIADPLFRIYSIGGVILQPPLPLEIVILRTKCGGIYYLGTQVAPYFLYQGRGSILNGG